MYINESISEMIFPSTSEIQIYSSPHGIKRFSNNDISVTFSSCSRIWSDAGFKVFRTAVKYPFKHDDMEINGRDTDII